MKYFLFPVLVVFVLCALPAQAQQPKDSSKIRVLSLDSAKKVQEPVDGVHRRVYSPRTAAIRSAILPGLGQIYNRKYWKVPIVWGALGVTGSIFLYNIKEYHHVRFAYFTLLNKDTANFVNVSAELKPFITYNDLASLRNYRNEFRKNVDYSVLFFILFWGLNVVDATVDAHLKGFDISKDLSLKIKPSINSTPGGPGISLVVSVKKPVSRWANTTPGR